jgi:adenosylcobinamide-GDP ribazoletransferase
MIIALRSGIVHELRLFFIALQFLTRVPVPRWCGHEAHWLNQCVRYFPLVGALVGGVGALTLAAASMRWPPTVAAALAVLTTLWSTGAFHEDGLADTFDALGGNVPRDKALAIMKDSRVGTYGVCALMLVLGLRVGLLGELLEHGTAHACLALSGSNVFGRGGAVLLMGLLPYAGDVEHAKAKPLAVAVPRNGVTLAMVMTVALAVLLAANSTCAGAQRWAIAVLAALGVVLSMRRWLVRRLGGYTGDTLGATEQLCEVAVLGVLAAQ